MNLYRILLRKAHKRFPGKKLEPMPTLHSIKEGLQVEEQYHFAMLQYHVEGDKSSHCEECRI